MKTVVFPEGNNEFIKAAAEQLQEICHTVLLEGNILAGARMVAEDQADAFVAGIDHSTRDVVLTVRDTIGIAEGQKTFSSLFVCDLPDGKRFIVSDGATCKNPTVEQLADIIMLNHFAGKKILNAKPKIAVLSFSTFGSGGKDHSIDKTLDAIQIVRARFPEIEVDGEMQLDTAVNPRIAGKKAENSPVAGQANVLIVPDLNSGNILYKSFEQFAHATVAGPVLLGFRKAASDLSRGSTAEDIILTTKILLSLMG